MFKNSGGEPIDTKEKAIVAIIHTSNCEQVPIPELFVAKELSQQFNIDLSCFYTQELCKECSNAGIQIWHYRDKNFEYKYKHGCQDCNNL